MTLLFSFSFSFLIVTVFFFFPWIGFPSFLSGPPYQVQIPLMLVLSSDFVVASLWSVNAIDKVKKFSQNLLRFLYHQLFKNN